MPPNALIIIGALPWPDPTPLRASRWSDLVRARPVLAASDGGPFDGHPALVAAYHALTHRVDRVILWDPAHGALDALVRMATCDDAVLVCDDLLDARVAAAIVALAAAVDVYPILIPSGQLAPASLAALQAAPIVVGGTGTFTPPGRFKAYTLSGSALAAPLVLGAVAQLGPQAVLVTIPTLNPAPGSAPRLIADVRGVIRLVGAFPPRPGQPKTTPDTAPGDPDAAIFQALERTLSARIEAHAFTGLRPAEAKAAAERELRPILSAALKRGDIDAFSLEVELAGDQLIVDARVRAPRRVKTVQLRLTPLDRPNP